MWDDSAGTVAEDDVSEFQGLGLARVLGTDNLARPSGKEESRNEQVDRVVDCAGFGGVRVNPNGEDSEGTWA